MGFTTEKAPTEIKTFSLDWAQELSVTGDTALDSSSWTADTGITIVSVSFSGTVANVKTSGGTDRETYTLTNTVTGNLSGSTLVDTIRVIVQS